jgi:hypothetical protein
MRLAEDYERKQAAEEEDVRRRLEQQSAMRQVRNVTDVYRFVAGCMA